MRSLFSVIHYLQQNGDKPVDVTVDRDGQGTASHHDSGADGGKRQAEEYRLGFLLAEPVTAWSKLPFAKALNRSLQENKTVSRC